MTQRQACRTLRWRATTLAGLLAVLFSPLAQTQDLAPAPASVVDSDVRTLLRIAQMSDWVGEPVSLAQGICVQPDLSQEWPSGHIPTDRQLQRLQTELERCVHQVGTPQPGAMASPLAYRPGDRGLLTGARTDFDTRLRRLVMLRLGLQTCWKFPADSTDQVQCLQRWAGRRLSAEEQRRLLALGTAGTETR